jgi:cholesterol oxidase
MITGASGSESGQAINVLILTSCLYPPNLLRQRLAFKMMDRITQLVREEPGNSIKYALLVAGDSIYADASAGLMDPTEPRERFELAYRRLRATPSWQQLSLVIHNRLHTIDDHEIIDNWEPSCKEVPDEADDSSNPELMEQAKQHFLNFISTGGVDPHESEAVSNKLWGRRHIQGLNFFLLDTRTEREPRRAETAATAKMISEEQKSDVLAWLDELHKKDVDLPGQMPSPKFIMSGSMLLPRRVAAAHADNKKCSTLPFDSWDGYPNTRNTVLAHIAAKGIHNVIFLSGDEHLPSKTTIRLTNSDGISTTAYSLHGSPLHAPLPFANSAPWAFVKQDQYTFATAEISDKYTVEVNTQFPSVGNGFLRIEVASERPSKILVEFVGDRDSESAELILSRQLTQFA